MRADDNNLANIALDEFGRAILSDEALEGVEMAFAVVFAGGTNGVCSDSTNGTCSNQDCSNSSNSSNCSNTDQCLGVTNSRICDGVRQVGCGQ
jgi:hypothetical protein